MRDRAGEGCVQRIPSSGGPATLRDHEWGSPRWFSSGMAIGSNRGDGPCGPADREARYVNPGGSIGRNQKDQHRGGLSKVDKVLGEMREGGALPLSALEE